ncbi:MAG: serine/threonine protein kinase [Planctomycetes bacterium]|nr:serine/threonine protein kinase [Planctomycetota bacterium]MBI3834408.1 serine/threonine protein kinase [Planctomycetota bacterium]
MAINDPLPGFRILKQIGVGAASKIYTSVELRTNKSFAVKHVIRNSADDDRFLEQAETEFACSSQIDNPYLRRSVSIHRIRKLLQTREIYLVMELVDGLTLDVARPNRLNTFLTLFQKISAGLTALHDAGWVHADIKPINIMLAPKGIVKIIDFGQACKIGHRKERVQGTPDYIAPEQVRRLPLDQRTDVFNLGATMYWTLTSMNYPTAIRGQDARPGVAVLAHDKPVAPIELNDKIPLALSKLVMECCNENPEERPVDMKQVSARLSVVQDLWRKFRENVRAGKKGQAPGVVLNPTPDRPSVTNKNKQIDASSDVDLDDLGDEDFE